MTMPLRARATVAASIGAIAFAAALAAPAHSVAPASVSAVAPMKFPAKLRVTLPAGGTATTNSPPLPADAKSATVTVSTDLSKDDRLLLDLYMNLATLSNRGRLLTCASLGLHGAHSAIAIADEGNDVAALGIQASAVNAMQLCFQVVQYLATPRSAQGSKGLAPATPCPQGTINIPVAATAGTITATGKPTLAIKPPVVVKCTATANGIVMTVKPRSKKTTLRKVVGPTLQIGFASPTGSTASVPLTLSYAQPR